MSNNVAFLKRQEGRQSEGQFLGYRCLTTTWREERVMSSNSWKTSGGEGRVEKRRETGRAGEWGDEKI